MNWWKQFKPKACSVRLKSSTKQDALREVIDNLVASSMLTADLEKPAIKALLAREDVASTGIGMNVAIPHVELVGIDKAVCSLSVHPEGLEWAAVDGLPVHILFTVLRPADSNEHHDPERHLEMMRWIAKLAREPDFRSFAVRVKTKTELVNLLKEMSTV